MNETGEQGDDKEGEEVWKDILYQEEQKERDISLEWRDYVALFIASLQTVFLPLIILMLVLLAAGFLLIFLF